MDSKGQGRHDWLAGDHGIINVELDSVFHAEFSGPLTRPHHHEVCEPKDVLDNTKGLEVD